MVREESLECRDCGDEFNPNLPYHSENGYRNQCGDCAEEEDVKKALINVNADGDVVGMKIVDSNTYNKVQRAIHGDSKK